MDVRSGSCIKSRCSDGLGANASSSICTIPYFSVSRPVVDSCHRTAHCHRKVFATARTRMLRNMAVQRSEMSIVAADMTYLNSQLLCRAAPLMQPLQNVHVDSVMSAAEAAGAAHAILDGVPHVRPDHELAPAAACACRPHPVNSSPSTWSSPLACALRSGNPRAVRSHCAGLPLALRHNEQDLPQQIVTELRDAGAGLWCCRAAPPLPSWATPCSAENVLQDSVCAGDLLEDVWLL